MGDHRINICFTKKDKDLIAWVNMLIREGLSPASWVQAILLSEVLGLGIDAGGVYVPTSDKGRSARPQSSMPMFGDDTVDEPVVEKDDGPSRWEKKGDADEYRVGTILSIRVTRGVMSDVLDKLKLHRKRISPYAKAVLRKHIRKLSSGPDQPPAASQIQDLFVLYEDALADDEELRKLKLSRGTKDQAPAPKRGSKAGGEEAGAPALAGERSEGAAEEREGKKNPLLKYIG